MKSPFPGFDPYLEQHWGDVHQRLAIYSSNLLQGILPGDLRARTEERVYVEVEGHPRRHIVPDVSVTEDPDGGNREWSDSGEGGTSVLEPVARVVSEHERESFVEIREKGGGRLVTVIEFLSPANKVRGAGRRLYRRKQDELRAAGVGLVEIDLVRTGDRVFDNDLPCSPDYDDKLMASYRKGIDFRLYAFGLRERLPVLPIPLRWEEKEEDTRLDLQPLHDQAYRDGAYDDIDYSVEPEPPLPPADAEWADALLRRAGLR